MPDATQIPFKFVRSQMIEIFFFFYRKTIAGSLLKWLGSYNNGTGLPTKDKSIITTENITIWWLNLVFSLEHIICMIYYIHQVPVLGTILHKFCTVVTEVSSFLDNPVYSNIFVEFNLISIFSWWKVREVRGGG